MNGRPLKSGATAPHSKTQAAKLRWEPTATFWSAPVLWRFRILVVDRITLPSRFWRDCAVYRRPGRVRQRDDTPEAGVG